MIRAWYEASSVIDSVSSIAVRSLNRNGRKVQHLQSRAWSKREGPDAPSRLVLIQWITVAVHRSNRSAAAVVHHERPFTSCAVIEIAMGLEQAGELVESLDRKYMLGRGRYLRFHFGCL